MVRKVAPLVLENRGILSRYYEREQRGIIDNYFKGIQNVYADEFRRADPVFFRTIGFGAMLNAFPVFFSTCLAKFSGFTVEDTTKVFRQIGELPIDAWRKMGSGNLAETQAGDDVRAAIDVAFKRNATGEAGVIKL